MEKEKRNRWGEKSYYSLDYYLKEQFGEKVYKIALDGRMSCPNRDGTLGKRGCIFCSLGGSGDFAVPPCKNVAEQLNRGIAQIGTGKKAGNKFIAYFQAYTNTYAPVEYLKNIFEEAIFHPAVAALSIATRPDCLPEEVLSLLDNLNKIKPVWVELGLQTANDKTAEFLRRGYPRSVFEKAVWDLKRISVETVVHVIIGLPYETKEELLNTIAYISSLPINGVKLQLLHILQGTDLADWFLKCQPDEFHVLSLEEYVELLLACVEHLPQDMVIHRITGDGPKKILLEPRWSGNKKQVLNTIHKAMRERGSFQGKAL